MFPGRLTMLGVKLARPASAVGWLGGRNVSIMRQKRTYPCSGIALLLLVLLPTGACTPLGRPTTQPHAGSSWVTISYAPGMRGTDPWSITVSESGEVSLEVRDLEEDGEVRRRYRQQLSSSEVDSIRAALRKTDLHRLQPAYESTATDQETLTIGTTDGAVRVYGPQLLCHQPEIQRFLTLWNAIVQVVEVPRTRSFTHRYSRCFSHESSGTRRIPHAKPESRHQERKADEKELYNSKMSRREKLHSRLRSEEAELRTLLLMNLRMVASGRNTMFFITIDGEPTAAGKPVLTLARRIIDLADQVGEPHSELVAAAVLHAFQVANDGTNEQRLGPIRLAQELLKQLGAT